MTSRILHVIESMMPGGIETTFLNALRAMRSTDDGESPHLSHEVLSFGPGPLESEYRKACDRLFIGGDLALLGRLAAEDYRVVHLLFDRCAHRFAPLLFSQSRAAIVYGKGYDLSSMYRMEGDFEWYAEESLMMACDAVTFTTDLLKGIFRVPGDNTVILEKAFDFQKFSQVPPPSSETPDCILCVANLHPRKRLGDLIPALCRVRRVVPTAEVRIVGGGNADEADRLKKAAADHGVADKFVLTGSSADVAAEIASARIIVLPSGCEGVPTSLLEGMAAARPVVATRVGHVTDIIQDGMEGFLIRPGDIDTLADRMLQLFRDRRLAAQMGARGRLRAANHDVHLIAERLKSVLQSAARRIACAP
jgi:glycosyltransferase involved in cell wall biosynthesis